jgi:RHS repeat-associated protein
VSCPTTTFCTANDGSGYAALYRLPQNVVQLTWDTLASTPMVVSDGSFDYVYGPANSPAEQVNLTTGTCTYMTFTPDNSSWLLTNSAGNQVGFWRYDAFGTLAFGTPASAFGYAGEYTDTTTGYSTLRARWYAPTTGGFTTRDPAFATTDTAYTYANSDPVNKSDPTGLSTLPPSDDSPSGSHFYYCLPHRLIDVHNNYFDATVTVTRCFGIANANGTYGFTINSDGSADFDADIGHGRTIDVSSESTLQKVRQLAAGKKRASGVSSVGFDAGILGCTRTLRGNVTTSWDMNAGFGADGLRASLDVSSNYYVHGLIFTQKYIITASFKPHSSKVDNEPVHFGYQLIWAGADVFVGGSVDLQVRSGGIVILSSRVG